MLFPITNNSSFSIFPLLPLVCVASLACSDDTASDIPDAAGNIDASVGQADATVGAESVPTESVALFGFLQSGDYDNFAAEPAVHASAGPHGQVRSFFNQSLAASLSAGNTTHPIGAASVKELYSSGAVSGWAVMVKTASAGTANDWYFYEIFSTTDGSSPVADSNGSSLCSGCHSSGTDYIRTSFP